MNKLLLGTLSLAVAISLNATVLATVNGKDITDTTINAMLGGAGAGMTYDKLPDDAKKKVLEQTIERELLANEASKSGIEKSENYKKALETLKKNLSLEMWMKQQFDKITITDAQAKKFYDENGDKFLQPAKTKARHILLKDEKAANEIINELKNLSGKKLEDKFIELAKTKSTGPSAKNGGELGWFTEKQMVPEFSKAAFALKKGEITKTPVKTSFGYHVIYSEDNTVSKKADFKEMKDRIISSLKMQKFNESVSNKAKALRKDAKVVIK